MRYIFFIVVLFFNGLKVLAQDDVLTTQSFRPSIKNFVTIDGTGFMSNYCEFGSQNLTLAFDDLDGGRKTYWVKFIHCTWDWKKSQLSDLDFLSQYNGFQIQDYDYSGMTIRDYTHYQFTVPPVKVPGNYILQVYENSDDNSVFNYRVRIYSQQTRLQRFTDMMGFQNLLSGYQLFHFSILYSNPNITNPNQQFHIVMQQNGRWDTMKEINPTYYRDATSELEFRLDDKATAFLAGNEFRFVDFRSVLFPGQNTGRVTRTQQSVQLDVALDKSRADAVYATYLDNNGQYFVDNLEKGSPQIYGDYVQVKFTLQTKKIAKPVYVMGVFNQWQKNDENRMTYNDSLQAYECTLLLKQGFYNYLYWVDDSMGFTFEGSHYETENKYDVWVYAWQNYPPADVLIGRLEVNTNAR